MKEILLNAGAQERFVNDENRATAFIGGLGSGKTFAMIAKGLRKATQPKIGFYGPRGCFAAINYPVLKDVVLPQFFEMMDGSELLLDYSKQEKKALLVPFNESGRPDRSLVKKDGMGAAEVLFRSLDQPNWMRGLELAYFGIDEGRHLTQEAWNVLYGRLRQRGYHHGGWVCSTPNGFDWMWTTFHPESKKALKGAKWYGAPTYDNAAHLDDEYVESLVATYEGRFLRQEVYGEFVGVVDGAVFFAWDQRQHAARVDYDPNEEVYSFWDFGMGDLGVVLYAQVMWRPSVANPKLLVPTLHVLEALEATDRTSRDWARIHTAHCNTKYGKQPKYNICDPAGTQRNLSTGTSIVDDLDAYGVRMFPAPKKPVDYAIRIVNNMLEGNRVLVDEERAERVAAAMASHKWPIDSSGVRLGVNPVHDWTSHYADAVRYGMTVLTGHGPRKAPGNAEDLIKTNEANTYGYINKQLDQQERARDKYIGQESQGPIRWEPGLLVPRER